MNASPNLTDPYDPMAGTLARTAMQCQARGCDGCLVCAPDSYARAPGRPTSGLEKINTDAADPWARDGAQSSMIIPESRANAGSGVAPSVGLNINILALDLGAKTGWALRRRDAALLHGTEDFTPRASWAPGQKWQRFRAWLSATIMHHNITQIAFEDVKRHGSGQVLAAHAYGGFRAMLEMVADQHCITLVPLGVGQIKKHWTGSGVAKKDAMVTQAKARGYRVLDDNNADALAILHLAIAREQGEWAAPRTKPKRTRKADAVAQERAA
ncbi:hypothetical protein AVE30378_01033 [Achromobacter veterisilvae]|uniref:Uncharacterized protein n=1 Tax=Achromobacter veterisilvae TaxID=2069367 RepID=A0A446C9A5_9BURK|nr:hypothetical protein [Achromobacter veterisilvae]SSW64331.1 hypothetical protein AVE30378_01033 [Achromobacter veterisilvae]